MSTTLTREQASAATSPAAPAAPEAVGASGRIAVMAVGLWGVVGSLLGYGIVMTVIKASALFA